MQSVSDLSFYEPTVTSKKVSKVWKKIKLRHLKVFHRQLRLMLTPRPLKQSDYGFRVQQQGKGLQPGREGASRSFGALQFLEIAQENEFLLQTIQLFACCLLELIFPPDHYIALTGRFAHTHRR